MKGNFFLGDGRFEVRDMAREPLGPEDVRIRNDVAGICGTDVHIWQGEQGSAAVNPPVVLGHEYSGTVLETGQSVTAFKPGDMVCVDPNIYCGKCFFCHNGQKHLCDRLTAVGVNRNGGFAQESVVPQAQCFSLNNEVDRKAAAMAEPLSCCLHGMDQVRVKQGETVLILGAGAIGLIMVQLCRLSGAARVIVSEPSAFRRETAQAFGADACTLPQDAAADLANATHGHGVDVIIECSGNTRAAQQCIALARKGTRILFFGVPSPQAQIQLPLMDMFQKELSITGSFINPDTFGRAVQLINGGRIRLAPLITHTYPLESLEEALDMQRSADSIKVVVLPNGTQEY